MINKDFIPIGKRYRMRVVEHSGLGKRDPYLDFFPEYQGLDDGVWHSFYDNGWLVHFSNFWLDRPADGEDRACACIYQSMEYTLIECALQKHLNPSWYSYQEAHSIPYESPPWIPDPEVYIREQTEKLNRGWKHEWIQVNGHITRAIVPPEEGRDEG